MERFTIQRAFMELKPFCDSLSKNPSIENARKVAECIGNISDAVVQDLFEYILLPIVIHLQNERLSKDIKEELVITARVLILKTRITKLALFNKLYTCVLMQIYDKSQPTMVISSHEELKETVVLCIKDLIDRCFMDVIESLYIRENAPKLAQGIYMCVSLAKIEKSSSLRLAAIETLMSLCRIDASVDENDIILQDQVGDVIMLILPGIASGLLDIATRTDIQNHKITLMAIRAWGRVISLVMHDSNEDGDVNPSINICVKNNSNISNDPLGTSLRNKNSDAMKTFINTVKRNSEWFDAASKKLNVLVQELSTLQSHSHWKVRKELATAIRLLLNNCSRNMKPSVMELIQYLISLSEDNVKDVSEEAKYALEEINVHYMQSQSMRPLIELLEESFYDLLTKLPRIIRKSDSCEQLSCLNQLAGYLRLLGKQRLPYLMASTPHAKRLILSLLYTIELDCSDIPVLEDVSIKDLDEPSFYELPSWKEFKFIQDTTCKDKITSICNILGQFGDLRILTDHILNLMLEMPQYKKEFILLLNWIISAPSEDPSVLNVYKDIVDCYINPELWYSPIEVTSTVPLRIAQSNIAQSCLLTEGLGYVARTLKQDYEQFLLKTLYLVIERAGNGHGLISSIGIVTLNAIAESQGHKSIRELLRANVDYFSYHVTIKLRRVERNPGVLDVIGIVMKYSTMDVMACLKEIVQDIFLQLKSSFQKRNSYSFLKVFYTFIVCVKKFTENNDNISTGQQNTIDVLSPHEKVIRSLLEYYEAKKIDEKIEEDINVTVEDVSDIHEDERIDENDPVYVDEKEESENLPNYVELVEDVMKHCLHFMPSKEISKSLIAMSTLQEGVMILSKWENRLLPIVHQLWHPLVQRFHDANVLVINRAWQLLRTLAVVSKDFIRTRTFRQIWSALSKFLEDSAKNSYNKDTGRAYRFTQTYKLQKELLSGLAEIAINLRLQELELWKILSITESYLSAQQNPVLQDCCVMLYKSVADYNGDITLIKCLSIWHRKVTPIVCDATFNIKDLKIADECLPNEYYKNVQTVIAYIENKNNF